MAMAAQAYPATAATQGRTVKWRMVSPRAMMTVCGSFRFPNTVD
jgi:hypothetical protein